MGKFRKMLAGVLSAAMVLSTMTVTAFAETSTTTPATIDTTKTGSITIHKYEYNNQTNYLSNPLVELQNENIMNRVEKLAQEKQQM